MRSFVREENGESANEHRMPLSIPSFPDFPKSTTSPTKYWCWWWWCEASALHTKSIDMVLYKHCDGYLCKYCMRFAHRHARTSARLLGMVRGAFEEGSFWHAVLELMGGCGRGIVRACACGECAE